MDRTYDQGVFSPGRACLGKSGRYGKRVDAGASPCGGSSNLQFTYSRHRRGAWIHFRERPPFRWMGSLGVGAGLLYLRTGAFLDPVRKEPWFQAIERDLKYAD